MLFRSSAVVLLAPGLAALLVLNTVVRGHPWDHEWGWAFYQAGFVTVFLGPLCAGIGTWDGANIEMAEAMGVENMFVFGLRADAVAKIKSLGYDPRLHYEESRVLRRVIDAIAQGDFSPGEPGRYRALVDALLQRDSYLLLADFHSYLEAQAAVDQAFRDRAGWDAKAIRNIAGMGAFSSDRTIREYAQQIWGMTPAP